MGRSVRSAVGVTAVALAAALDFVLIWYSDFSNKAIVPAVVVLQVGAWYWYSRPDERDYWLGFEAAGWLYVLFDYRFYDEVRAAIIALVNKPFVREFMELLIASTRTSGPTYFVILASAVEFAATLLAAVAGGELVSRYRNRRYSRPS